MEIGDKYIFIGEEQFVTMTVIVCEIREGEVVIVNETGQTYKITPPFPSKEDYKKRLYAGYFVKDNPFDLLSI